jgi:glycosyltransferase involved in cell wall biosynthesis
MRLLFLSNFYPPCGSGGYEQWCQEVAEQLRADGHEVVVLTSQHQRERAEATEPNWVRRVLHLEMEFASLRNGLQFFMARQAHEQANLTCLEQSIAEIQPDAVLIWGMWDLPRSLPVHVERLLPGRVAYYMGDYWPTLPSQYQLYWEAPARNWLTWLPKAVLGFIARRMLANIKMPVPAFEHVIFPSEFMRSELAQQGVQVQAAKVIYGGADTSLYLQPQGARSFDAQDSITLLYAGRLRPDKGTHVAIEALSKLVHQHKLTNIHLQIVGTGEAEYLAHLHTLVAQYQLGQYVTFLGGQPKAAMPRLYQQSDIFLFTSIWQEPFGRVLVEAMAAGTVVVGSATGGAAEILLEDVNGLTFAPGDADGLAAQVARLVASPALQQRLAATAQKMAVEKFDIRRMAQGIASYLRMMTHQHENSISVPLVSLPTQQRIQAPYL